MIPAAGGVVWRSAADGGFEVVVIHRPRYDDWSLPKGKLDPGEHTLEAGVREVCEETGLHVVVGRRGLRTRYPVRQGTKRVDYWLMRSLDDTLDREPDHEVDEVRWLPVERAEELVTHEHDRSVLADAARADLPRAPALLLVRHADAGDRDDWAGPDRLRPLNRRGQEQARRLAEVLPDFGPVAVLSADRVRCRETVAPLAQRLGLPLGTVPELGEEEYRADPQAGMAVVQRLLEPRPDGGVTVVCSQGGAIPSVLLALGVRWEGTSGALWPPSSKGSVWALGGRPGALAADYYRDFEPDLLGPGQAGSVTLGSQAGRRPS